MPHRRLSHPLLHFFYQTVIGKILCVVVVRRFVSMLAGWYCNRAWSRRHIKPFIQKHDLNMNEYVVPKDGFATFNEFFIREFKSSARTIDSNQDTVIAPCDGTMLSVENLGKDTTFPVKGLSFSLEKFLGSKEIAEQFYGGTLMLFRLAPWHYHRFHFPFNGIPQKAQRIKGLLHSVHPLVFTAGVQALTENERHSIKMKTDQVSDWYLVPIGALCVGTITETYLPNIPHSKGDEVGHFSFGGSSLGVLFAKDAISLEQEKKSVEEEIPVRLGEVVARRA